MIFSCLWHNLLQYGYWYGYVYRDLKDKLILSERMIELLVISDIMYIECVMVAHAETQVDQEMHNIKEKDHLVSRIEVEQTP